jgi:hypothetical protein
MSETDPTLAPVVSPDKLAEFESSFARFMTKYLETPKGQEHLAAYAPGRESAVRNYDEIVAAADRGEDVTDAVLLKLLPHYNTVTNRERGAWVHIAPAVQKDVKVWFEGSKWTKPEDWPLVAAEILRFVRRSVEDPSQLAESVKRFTALPYSKGFQTGILTPILNALRPDDFVLMNGQARNVYNSLAGTKHGLSLSEYPAHNATGLAVREALAPIVRKFPIPQEARESDLVDAFSFFVSIDKPTPADIPASTPAEVASEEVAYWKVAPGENGWQWPECRKKGFIAVGWDFAGDLSGLSRAEFDARVDELLERNAGDFTRAGISQLWQFAQIKLGDRIVANRGLSQVLGIGTVIGSYAYVAGERHAHRLPVRWDDTTPRQHEAGRAWQWTLRKLTREEFEVIGKAPSLDGPLPFANIPEVATRGVHEPEPLPTPRREVPLSEVAEQTGFDVATLTRWMRAIERKGQAILFGPPGTGKTFVARRLAEHFAGGGYGLVELVQFHPAYAYEDFIAGIRPRGRKGGGLAYPVVPGRFVDFCERARDREGTSVLILDEINRTNLARVFGELMYLLEYRDETIPLASGRTLSIPGNVRLIGTMNTADRSIALVDHALRRRFAFLWLPPKFDVLRRYHAGRFDVDGLVQVLENLNQAIDDANYAIGISFFMRDDLGDSIEDIWSMEIEPYLEEYFFDRKSMLAQFRWKSISSRVLGAAAGDGEPVDE